MPLVGGIAGVSNVLFTGIWALKIFSAVNIYPNLIRDVFYEII